jgi:putative salt-induced outer membrane protein YdiY
MASDKAFGKKEDLVILKNGDKITGEIKELSLGKLKYSTDDMGTIYIEWDKIKALQSKNYYELERKDGIRWFGAIDTDTIQNKILVVIDTLVFPLELLSIVGIVRIKGRFWARVDASTDFGFSYTKASTVAQLNFAGDISYRGRLYFTKFSLSSILTSQEEKEDTKFNQSSIELTRFFENNWIAGTQIKLEQNTELGLDLRTTIGGGVGRYIIKSNFSQLGSLVGILFNREKETNKGGSDLNLEGLLTVMFKQYRFDDPELDLTSNLSLFPSLAPFGRFRLDFETKLKWEIFKDFFWKLTFYDKLNSEPPEGASKNDWSVILSFGWSK